MPQEIKNTLDFKNVGKIVNLPDGVDPQDAATVHQLNNLVSGGGNIRINGCVVSWSGTGLIFDVTPGVYTIIGVVKNFAGGSIILDAADPTLPRFDILALDDTETLIKITGTPGANPDIPQVDPDTQLYLTAIYVAAGATTPSNIDLSLIYSENTEWAGSTNGMTADFNDTTQPFAGLKDIKVSASTNGGYLSFVSSSPLNVTDYSILKLYCYLASSLNNKSNITAIFYNGTTKVSDTITLPLNKSTTGSYQNLSINLTDFQFAQASFDTLRIAFTGNTFSVFYLDYIQLQGVPGSTQIVQVYDATATVKGILKLTGDLGGTADDPTVPELVDKLNITDYKAVRFKGTWDANTNIITSADVTLNGIPMPAATDFEGCYFVVSADGTTTVDGISSWVADDWIVSNGTVWKKINNSGGALPIASTTVLGGIKVGANLSIDPVTGVLDASAGGSTALGNKLFNYYNF